MFHRIALFKLDADVATASLPDLARRLREALGARGYESRVGVPADEAAAKSWDLALTVSFRTLPEAQAFDASARLVADAGLAADRLVVVKTWVFEG